MPATQLKTVPPSRSPERGALAEAIERHAAATAQLARLKMALEASEGALYGDGGATRAVDRAEEQLKEAKANEPRHLAAVALGEATDDADPIRAAERALTEAQAQLDRARKTRDALTAEASDATSELDQAKRKIDDAIRDVFASEAGAAISSTLCEAAALQEQLGAKRLVLSFLREACFETWPPNDQLKPIENFLFAPPYPLEASSATRAHPSLAPWRLAQEALRTDADAPLPT
jgi:chromosome segregation ATPase